MIMTNFVVAITVVKGSLHVISRDKQINKTIYHTTIEKTNAETYYKSEIIFSF